MTHDQIQTLAGAVSFLRHAFGREESDAMAALHALESLHRDHDRVCGLLRDARSQAERWKAERDELERRLFRVAAGFDTKPPKPPEPRGDWKGIK